MLMWLHSFQKLAIMSGWTDQEAIDYLELHLRGKDKQWFVGLGLVTDFAWLRNMMTSRFGETQTTLMTRLDFRKQQPKESVRD